MDGFTTFYVVKNQDGFYSIFPVDLPIPNGWEVIDNPGSKEECLAKIRELWTSLI